MNTPASPELAFSIPDLQSWRTQWRWLIDPQAESWLLPLTGFWIIGLPYFALLGALTGLLALVPLIGTLLAAVPALLVAFAAPNQTGFGLPIRGGWPLALAAAAVLVLVQQLDQRLLSPRMHIEAVRLHPVTVVLSPTARC